MMGRQGSARGAEKHTTLHRSIRRTMALCVAVCALLGLLSIKLLAGSYDEAFAAQQSEVAERYFSQLKTCIIVPQFCGVPFFIFLNMQFMRGVPRELDEAAEIDGCGWLRTYTNILLPLSKPSLITSSIFAFYWSWQEFLGPLIYLNKPKKYTVSIALKMFADPSVQTNWSGLFAMTTLSIIPVVAVFMFFQKYLVEGVATTGLKA